MWHPLHSGGRHNVPMLSLPIAGLSAAVALLTLTGASAGTLAGAEIDADQLSPGDALFSQTADDWAESGGSAAEGVFLLGSAGSPDFTGCYGSDLSVNPSISGAAGFICDGSSDSRFDGNGGDTVVEPEMNIVSPGGKQIDDIWNVKQAALLPRMTSPTPTTSSAPAIPRATLTATPTTVSSRSAATAATTRATLSGASSSTRSRRPASAMSSPTPAPTSTSTSTARRAICSFRSPS